MVELQLKEAEEHGGKESQSARDIYLEAIDSASAALQYATDSSNYLGSFFQHF